MKPAARAVTGCWAPVVLAALAGAAMTIVTWGDLSRGGMANNLGEAAGAVAFATLGTLIVRRAGNVIGWIMMGMAGTQAFVVLAWPRPGCSRTRAGGAARPRRGLADHPEPAYNAG